ncbi:hypothetical protein ACE14D_17250 [Streptomyces sp. Act-28]
MRRKVGPAVSLAALALLAVCGCSADGTRSCTLVDAPGGIGVEVPPELARGVADATLTVCWDDTCRKHTLWARGTRPHEPAVPGDPVTTTRSAGATGSPATTPLPAPERFVRPGFTAVRDLPGKPVLVILVLRSPQGATVLDRRIRITPQLTHPNGRNCSPGGHQAYLTVTEEGALVPR